MNMQALTDLLRETLRDPRGVAAALIRMGVPMQARWVALALMAVASALLTHVGMAMMLASDELGSTIMMPSPVATALTQFGVLIATSAIAAWAGRWAGGQGRFADAVLLMAWLQFVLLVVQVAQMVVLLLVPPLGALLGYVALALFFWLLTAFVAELHGFRSLGLTFIGVILTVLAAAFVLALLLYPVLEA